jgi:hypothetical protein
MIFSFAGSDFFTNRHMPVTISNPCNKQSMTDTIHYREGPTLPVTGYVTKESHLKHRDSKARAFQEPLLENNEPDHREEVESSRSLSSSTRQGGRAGRKGEDDGISLSTKFTEVSSVFSKEEDSLIIKQSSSATSYQSLDEDEQVLHTGDDFLSLDDHDIDIYDIFGAEAYKDFENGFGLKTSRERDIARKEFLREKYDLICKKNVLVRKHKGIPSYIKKPFYSVVRPTRDCNPKLKIPKRSFDRSRRNFSCGSTISVFERMDLSCAQKNQEGKKMRAKIQAKILENEKRRNGELCRVRGKISAEQGSRLYNEFLANKMREEQELLDYQMRLQLEEEERQKYEKRISLDKALRFYHLEMMWLVRKERIVAEHADQNGENYKPTMNLNQMLKYYMALQSRERDNVETLLGRKISDD